MLFQAGATFSDEALMPGWGSAVSGTTSAPVIFGSYGQGRASLPQGVWFRGDSNLVFENLDLGPSSGDSGSGFQGDGNGIMLVDSAIHHAALGVNSHGNGWTIADDTITDTGDSGMLLGYTAGEPGDPAGGNGYVITGNTITNTGLNPADNWGTHGIYDKVTNARITDNTITNFRNDGISVRYRDSVISGNRISGGEIGLAWFQYDATAGTSRWIDNIISNVSSAGIFVCGTREGCRVPLESFDISGNSLVHDGGDLMNLQPTTGRYAVSNNG